MTQPQKKKASTLKKFEKLFPSTLQTCESGERAWLLWEPVKKHSPHGFDINLLPSSRRLMQTIGSKAGNV